MKSFAIHTPPYSRGRLVEDPAGDIVRLSDLSEQVDLGRALVSAMRRRTEDAISVSMLDELDRVLSKLGGKHV